jgi:hypothetical protein
MANRDDLKNAVREVLNEGTAQGQSTWRGTSKATLGTVQALVNILRGEVIAGKLPVSSGDLKAILDAQAKDLKTMRQEIDELKSKLAS